MRSLQFTQQNFLLSSLLQVVHHEAVALDVSGIALGISTAHLRHRQSAKNCATVGYNMVQPYLQVLLSALNTKVCTMRHQMMHLIVSHCSVAGPFQGLTKDVEIATVP